MYFGNIMNHAELQVLWEDQHLLVVNKPAGILVQEDISRDLSLLSQCKT